MKKALKQLENIGENVGILEVPVVPWFPTKLDDLDNMGKVLTKGLDFEDVDHPSFKDKEYY